VNLKAAKQVVPSH